MSHRKKVLIVGVSGLVGYAAARYFSAQTGWDVVGVSRRLPQLDRVICISLDLLDRDQCHRVLSTLGDVTHVVYAAVRELPGLAPGRFDPDTIRLNGDMLMNVMDPLLSVAVGFEHISLLQGTKAYGLYHSDTDYESVKSPLLEREPRREHPNFYFVQEDYLLDKRKERPWSATVWRPTVIYGEAIGNNMNPIPALAAYAAILREQGEPLHFPGREASPAVAEALDADLLARALGWAAVAPEARNQTFNLTNGDVFGWQYVWPAISEAMGMEVGEHRPACLAEMLPRWQCCWARIVEKYDLLAPWDLMEFVGVNSAVYTDSQLLGADKRGPRRPVPILNSTIKVRRAGFHGCVDSEEMFVKLFRTMQDRRLIPPR